MFHKNLPAAPKTSAFKAHHLPEDIPGICNKWIHSDLPRSLDGLLRKSVFDRIPIMIRNDRRSTRRLLAIMACCILMVFLIRLIPGSRVQLANSNKAVPNVSTVELRKNCQIPEKSSPIRSRASAEDQIPARVKTLLNIRQREIGIITLPATALQQNFGPSKDPSITNFSILRNIVDKKSLASSLEGILQQGGSAQVQVIDQSTTEYSGKDFQLKIEVMDRDPIGDHGEVLSLRIQVTNNGLTLPYELSAYSGHSLVFQLPPPADTGLVIQFGNDPIEADDSKQR